MAYLHTLTPETTPMYIGTYAIHGVSGYILERKAIANHHPPLLLVMGQTHVIDIVIDVWGIFKL